MIFLLMVWLIWVELVKLISGMWWLLIIFFDSVVLVLLIRKKMFGKLVLCRVLL